MLTKPDLHPADSNAAATAPAARWRALVRGSELGLIALAAVVGLVSGLVVTGIGAVAQAMHDALFALSPGERLSSARALDQQVLLWVPAAGGALLTLMLLAQRRWLGARGRPAVDPIEANALHGGRMSMKDSAFLVVQNVVSNGCGASVGLEAGYTQMAAGLASRLGQFFEMRRADLRTLVGCGAAAAIAAAFGAPLTGAFYAFELIIGTYSVLSLAPVVVAALVGSLVARIWTEGGYVIAATPTPAVAATDYLPALILAVICAGLGIVIMRGVTLVEWALRRTRIPPALRPPIGGLCVGAIAILVTPQVLSAGHGALSLNLAADTTAPTIAILIGVKVLASALSIGSGFRGGLFFASLFLGSLVGKLFALVAPALFASSLPAVIYAVVGMSALGVAVIGGPLTMTFLALEVTGDLPVTALVLAGVIASSVTVRRTFGYSFATWRFHLRGESIRSAHDVGWIRTLTVGQMMRRDVRTVRDDTTLAAFLRAHPLGSTQRVVTTDAGDRYAGIVLVADAHASSADGATRIEKLARYRREFLLPQMNAKEAAGLFERCESEALPVVDDPATRKVIGLLTEAHTLRRYSEELDRRQREMTGELATPPAAPPT